MKWRNKRQGALQTLKTISGEPSLIVFDTETTGLKKTDKIIQFSAVRYQIHRDLTLEETGFIDKYINPEMDLPEKIIEITGITEDILRDEPNEYFQYPEIMAFMNTSNVWCAYNAAFDIRMLQQMHERLGVSFEQKKVLDVMEMAKDLISTDEVENHKLGTITEYLFPDEDFRFHSAIQDVLATGKGLEIFLKEYLSILKTPEEEVKVQSYVKYASLWINPYQQSQQRIRVALSHGDYGDIYWDVIKKEWSHKKTKSAEKLFQTLDLPNMEQQILNRYAWKYPGVRTMAELSKAWAEEKMPELKKKAKDKVQGQATLPV